MLKTISRDFTQVILSTRRNWKSPVEKLIAFGTSALIVYNAARDASEIPCLLPTAHANESLEVASYPWSHAKPWQAFDTSSIRRGYQVYQQVCASCHAMRFLSYRNLVGVAYTEAEAKQMASEIDVEDGPNDKGEMFERPGKLTDPFPRPYPNEAAARASNNGSYPPDLSLIVKARPGAENYIFSLISGYSAPPPGVEVKENMYYNPYFPGSQIAMPQQLTDGCIEYDDGTEASISQMAKDVTTFLAWAAEPHQDEHKKFGLKACLLFTLLACQFAYFKRLRWGIIKHRVTAIKK
ncbi:uncharacterized protein LOC126315393 [Schistocerca gregaria]|uniref:uncharacterized protein LOC126315393 n=1 Tax=Schistocerca gregaria TaxID=7010 RepID=UPI00211E5DD9|nr:uncharacterized protein LOC126315393 [Schistocerca gregaria]XP_049848604.1 uncharacterized protein LOC126315393 [Schistocerca gregaria]